MLSLYVAFHIKASSTKSIVSQPKLITDGDPFLALKSSDSFRYLASHVDSNMSNNAHKSELSDSLNTTLSEIDLLRLHPKRKRLLYKRYLLFKPSWHFTVVNHPKNLVCTN